MAAKDFDSAYVHELSIEDVHGKECALLLSEPETRWTKNVLYFPGDTQVRNHSQPRYVLSSSLCTHVGVNVGDGVPAQPSPDIQQMVLRTYCEHFAQKISRRCSVDSKAL